MLLIDALNSNLDKLVRPKVHILRRSWSAFQVCGYLGLSLAFFLVMLLVLNGGLSPVVVSMITLAAALTFFGLVMATRIITGEEKIIYYHHEIAVMVVAAVLLWLLGQPILPYLDLTILGIGIFLACGRVGCLMVGCCHGRPSRWGACYRADHAAVGFSPYLVDVRLFPIQAVESFWVLCIVIVGTTFVLRGYPAGTALAWYVVAYDLGRFWFEFLRGDPDRPYYRGFSQPQWISIILLFGIVWSELSGLLPFQAWHIGITGFVSFTMLAVALKRRLEKSNKYQLLHPRHIKEVAEAVELVSSRKTKRASVARQSSVSESIHIACTSLGVQVSASHVKNVAGDIYHYALSGRNGALTEEAATAVAKLILQLKPASGSNELIRGDCSVFHLLIHSANR
ncbi:MAG: prolipoprotein diacylglyceryl transferase family protein [Blastocatellia bacterium]